MDNGTNGLHYGWDEQGIMIGPSDTKHLPSWADLLNSTTATPTNRI